MDGWQNLFGIITLHIISELLGSANNRHACDESLLACGDGAGLDGFGAGELPVKRRQYYENVKRSFQNVMQIIVNPKYLV